MGKTFATGEVLSAADVNEYLAGDFWKRIARAIIPSGSPVTSVNFASISSSYRVFRLTIATSQICTVRFNNDSGSNYKNQSVLGDGATISGSRTTTTSITTASGDQPSLATVIIAKLATGTVALTSSTSAGYFSTNPYVGTFGGVWTNTSALINRIDAIGLASFYGVVTLEGLQSV